MRHHKHRNRGLNIWSLQFFLFFWKVIIATFFNKSVGNVEKNTTVCLSKKQREPPKCPVLLLRARVNISCVFQKKLNIKWSHNKDNSLIFTSFHSNYRNRYVHFWKPLLSSTLDKQKLLFWRAESIWDRFFNWWTSHWDFTPNFYWWEIMLQRTRMASITNVAALPRLFATE